MFKITITREGVQTNSASFQSMEELNAWFDSHKSMGTFGQNEVLQTVEVSPAVYEDGDEILDGEGNSFDPPQFEQVLVTPAVTEEQVVTPVAYEFVIEDLTAQMAQEAQIASLEAAGAAARKACERVLNLIGGMNLLSGSIEQTDQMQVTFAEVEKALASGRPGKALALINAIEPDGVVVTEQMKQLAMSFLAAYAPQV